MTDVSAAQRLFFNSQCFASPLAHPSYPEFKIPPAWYSPFINAMLLPNYKNPGLRWANLLMEYPHRWLDVTTSMCLLRYFAGLAYDAIFDLVLDKDAQEYSEDKHLTYRNSIEDVIDTYISQIAPLQEAYALYWVVAVLRQNNEPESKFLEHKYIAEASWNSFDEKTRYVYSELVNLSNRIGTAALSGITGSLNMAWPDMPPRDSSDPSHIVKLRNHFIQHIEDPSNNPLLRFQNFVHMVKDSALKKNMSRMSPDEVGLFLYDNCPGLRPYFIDPCSHSCVCRSIQEGILKSDPQSHTYSPFFWAISLSTSIRADCQIEHETEAPSDSEIALIRKKQPRSLPYLLFSDDKCHVQNNVPDISTVARLAMFESIRQQENQFIRRGRRQAMRLECPWESIEAFVDDEPSGLDVFDAKADWNRKLFADYWHSVQRFGFAKIMNAPICVE